MTEIIGKMMELTENSKVDLTWSERSKWEIKIMTSCCGEGNVEVSGFSYQQLTTACIPHCFIYLILPSLSSTHFHSSYIDTYSSQNFDTDIFHLGYFRLRHFHPQHFCLRHFHPCIHSSWQPKLNGIENVKHCVTTALWVRPIKHLTKNSACT